MAVTPGGGHLSGSGSDVAVLFSGGRDSSLVACKYAVGGHQVHLLTGHTGTGFGAELSDFRLAELQRRFPSQIHSRTRLSLFSIFRRIAIADIEDDFLKYRKNLILLGEKLALHAAATVYCLDNNITTLADGSSAYQADLAEQTGAAITALQSFEAAYGITYVSPLRDYSSEEQVRYELLEFGITTKSLESVSLFGDSFSEPSPELVDQYIAEKLPLCHAYITRMLPNWKREQ